MGMYIYSNALLDLHVAKGTQPHCGWGQVCSAKCRSDQSHIWSTGFFGPPLWTSTAPSANLLRSAKRQPITLAATIAARQCSQPSTSIATISEITIGFTYSGWCTFVVPSHWVFIET
ncbi:hypothetical protein GGTG_08229 [Gaeumannomyces tritici R3-111a-1]|uniref:Uncharacterized protein n=1 Tax=Gaeumannomyces tritici (strain R3-111a-1) TaxID=644352 RepID=J3P3Z4_GAET3|nr:hypothetical protein GGTG_08229 [Gaeumannomyces tritici R3-111a-1]EJT74388.1 hypothetical protein GGTG_08229 [Gaeumannomyces tritici R3-111a-1]